jgi:hypothetical protein
MALMKFDLDIEYEDGTTEQVRMDQRDTAIWEMQKFGCSTTVAVDERPMQFFRWNAWHALKRTNRTTDTWEIWDAKTVEVMPVDDEEGSEVPNPGSAAAPVEG